ncbi:hypothetical protein MMC18_007265 [Xylographa bjoerkii]|nr:hypothetical protein [Xylographa bjoerkii]
MANSSVGGVLNMIYLKPVENAAAFEPFYSLPVIDDTTEIQTLTEMMSGHVVQVGTARGVNALVWEAVDQAWFVLDTSGDKIAHDATASIKAKIEAASLERGKYVDTGVTKKSVA